MKSIVYLLCLTSMVFIADSSKADDIINDVGMRFRLIKAGKLILGAVDADELKESIELPSFNIDLRQDFYMQTTEVTRESFSEFCKSTGYVTDCEREQNRAQLGTINTWRDTRFRSDTDLPVVMVSYNDANAFCNWLSGKEGKKYRLPTEAEWEFACRAEIGTVFGSSGDLLEICKGNCIGLSERANIRKLNPKYHSESWKCGSGVPNKFGLYDMNGNVAEIVDGYYLSYAKGLLQPSQVYYPPPTEVVTRGGSFYVGPEKCRCSSRSWIKRDTGNEWTGFRIVFTE